MDGFGARVMVMTIGCLALVGALVVGIDDNPPGIALIFGAMICLIASAVWTWRRPRSFLLLFAGSVLGFVVFAVLHNVLYGIGKMIDVG